MKISFVVIVIFVVWRKVNPVVMVVMRKMSDNYLFLQSSYQLLIKNRVLKAEKTTGGNQKALDFAISEVLQSHVAKIMQHL